MTEAIEYIRYHVYFLPARKLSTNNPAYTLYTVHELKIIPILPAQTVLIIIKALFTYVKR